MEPFRLVEISGEADVFDVAELRELLLGSGGPVVDVLVSLVDCEFLDSAATLEIFRCRRRLREAGHDLVIEADPGGIAYFVLHLVTHGALTTYPTRQVAELALQLGAPTRDDAASRSL